ncbi:unnamed protein product [Ambrosiozyma monospora]|uniref:Unnamed protein product n=1 Tax=Ambrosiozyma monospora TaxID=43982 RepID=A0ACB5T7E2_AMBMO|nr:unnamed protein product [Ambrosiozyma monospora]
MTQSTPDSNVKSLQHLFSRQALARQKFKLKETIKYLNDPNVVFLGGGLPMSNYFPWKKIIGYSPSAPFAEGIDNQPANDSDATIAELVKAY